MLAAACRKALRHHDRWRVGDMLRKQPDLSRRDAERDMDLWSHLSTPDDIVRVGHICRAACEATAAESCWGNTWAVAAIAAGLLFFYGVWWP
jgi:hypothetical protein